MLFSSLTFIYIFLPALFLTYALCKNVTYRKFLLTLFSLIFYAWGEPVYILLLLFIVFINYYYALVIYNGRRESYKKGILVLVIFINLLCLANFKYLGLIIDTLNVLPFFNIPSIRLALPVGISFFTFQAMSYTIDVYKGSVAAQKKFMPFLMYVSFFPQLVAGPIVRYVDIEKDIDNRSLNAQNMFDGLFRFSIGLAKKTLLANSLGNVCELLTTNNSIQSVLTVWLISIFFALQLYFDFSGYSDMAIGLGKFFNFTFPENFNHPYEASSATDFWRRWNISLSSFFRDYVYIPLGGKYKNQIRNIIIVWALTGLWHGASWNFCLWGLYYALILITEKYFLQKLFLKIPNIPSYIIRHLYLIFLTVVGFTIFYYTDWFSLSNALKNMFGFGGLKMTNLVSTSILRDNFILLIISVIGSLSIVSRVCQKISYRVSTKILYLLKLVVMITFIFLSTASLVGNSFNPFLYFRF
jgi:alginate O-acetyltransferase complex protein AlgI